ncbi:uncharacterized protein FIBRA_03401 [Fibroporia radiculosa]|uniref:Uncharacterized protein n=1 Tax=Fibroporia radiculosa TaxID=599839 RepID=J4I9L1_9APHY|nr:uncharacterized protein FIBRA_03401 [Fibroporia radiculosa]CCM01351.1 predicted protein [Fibroporia radiculosa]
MSHSHSRSYSTGVPNAEDSTPQRTVGRPHAAGGTEGPRFSPYPAPSGTSRAASRTHTPVHEDEMIRTSIFDIFTRDPHAAVSDQGLPNPAQDPNAMWGDDEGDLSDLTGDKQNSNAVSCAETPVPVPNTREYFLTQQYTTFRAREVDEEDPNWKYTAEDLITAMRDSLENMTIAVTTNWRQLRQTVAQDVEDLNPDALNLKWRSIVAAMGSLQISINDIVGVDVALQNPALSVKGPVD